MSGTDMKEFDLTHLRQNIGVVLQDDFMFRATIRQNSGDHPAGRFAGGHRRGGTDGRRP